MKHLFAIACWGIVLAGLFIACTKKPPVPLTTPPAPKGQEYQEDSPDYDPDEVVMRFPAETPPAGPIYFGLDSFALKEPSKVTALANYIKQRRGRTVDLAGHCSTEGTTEYNLALGARRAQAVRDYLEASGVPAGSIRWQSFGEESPVTEDPAQFNLNRRVEFIVSEGAL